MELLSRPKNDRYTRPGEYNELERRLRANPAVQTIPAVVAYAFDFRTRLGPYLFTDMKLVTAGPRAVGSALYQAGFTNTRIVLRQWNRNFRASRARLEGGVPELLLVSSMQIHSASAYEMIVDAHKLGDNRPLILAGGPKAIYEPWDLFGLGPDGNCSADAACTGEEFVLLELLDRLMEYRGRGEHLRKTFHRLRRSGLLDDIPGLLFREGDERDPLSRLVNTGVQRMVQNLDELPHPMYGLALLEPPHRRQTLSRQPVPINRLHRHVSVVSLVTTHGCKFRCPYCPIPAYNQFTFRYKSPDAMKQEVEWIGENTGISFYFGTDDNFFNNRETVEDIFTEMAKGKVHGKPFRDAVFYGTEATEFDVYKNQDLLPLCREGGLRAIWFGIEDMTAELVKKGQSPEKTKHLFEIMTSQGICPMSMMMHHDGQPLMSRGNLYGLLNQVRFLQKSGSVTLQVTILTPSVGSKGYEEPYNDGMVIAQAGAEKVEDHHYDGNHCIATHDKNPWRKQMNIYLAYVSFYNPWNFLKVILNWKDPIRTMRIMYQLYGMAGVVKSLHTGWNWLWNLRKGPVTKMQQVPGSRLEIISVEETTPREQTAPAMQCQSA
jgi:radical SAM superfamily enzyme YgiQ (UPF0313 family)